MERKRIGDLGELLSGAGAGADENCVENGREENVVEVEISCVAIILYYINNDLDWIGRANGQTGFVLSCPTLLQCVAKRQIKPTIYVQFFVSCFKIVNIFPKVQSHSSL